jgi:hypothetical protein
MFTYVLVDVVLIMKRNFLFRMGKIGHDDADSPSDIYTTPSPQRSRSLY